MESLGLPCALAQLPTEELRALVPYPQLDFQVLPINAASCESKRGQIPVAATAPVVTATPEWQRAGSGALAPSPTNFHLKKPTEDRAWKSLKNGVPEQRCRRGEPTQRDQRHP